MTTTHPYDTVVVGGGLAGLTATTHLAKAGRKVLLLERHSDLGGRARTDDLDGWLFDQGGHALYRNGVGHTRLRSLGVEPSGEPPPLAGAQAGLAGKTTLLPVDAKSLFRTKALSARSKVQFGALLTKLPKLDPAEFATTTVDEWLAQYRPDVAAVAKAVIRLAMYAAATDLLSADAAIAQLQGVDDGVLYLHDGWAALCDQITEVATTAGAEMCSGAKVESIQPTDGGYKVTTDDTSYDGNTVIVAAGGPPLTARLLGIEPEAFGTVGPPPEAAVLDLALDSMPANHRFILGIDEPTYFSVHSPPARLAPDGKVAAVAMRYLAPDDDGTPDQHRESLERTVALAGVDAPVRSRFLRRMTVTNGLPIAAAGGLAGRPSVEVAGQSGAFIAGDWVGPTGLLADAAIASGVAAATAADRTVAAAPQVRLG